MRSGSLSVTAMLDFSGEANTSIHDLEEDDTARELICHHKLKSDGEMVYVTMRICCVNVRVYVIYSAG